MTREARFPYLKTIDDFEFTLQSTLRPALAGSFLAPEFVTEGRSLVLHGKTGRGKTRLAIAIAYRAIQNGVLAAPPDITARCGKARRSAHRNAVNSRP